MVSAPPSFPTSFLSSSFIFFCRRTLSLFLESDDLRDIIDFFQEFSPIIHSLPPLSLSTYWKREDGKSLVGIEDSLMESNEESRILSVPELSYLHQPPDSQIMNFSPIEFEVQREAHDPLGIVQQLMNIAENLAHIPTISISERASALTTAFSLAIKSGRASLILSCCHTLAKFEQLSSSSYDLTHLFEEIQTFIQQQNLQRVSSSLKEKEMPLIPEDVILK
jgi:hypothetical protein